MTRIYAAMAEELLVASRQNESWRIERRLLGSSPQSVAADPSRPEVVYCGTFDRGLWSSVDAGDSWKRVGESVVREPVTAVAVSAAERAGGHGVVYVGTEPSAVYRSEDGGETWRELGGLRELPSEPEWSFPPKPETHHVRWISTDPNSPGRTFVAIEAGALIRSLDGGETWEDRTPDGPRDTHTLATHKDAPGRLYSAAGDGLMAPGRGYAESDDAGTNWRRFSEGLRHHYLVGLAVDPGDPETVVVSAASSPWEAHNIRAAESTIYRKTAGEPWREVRTGLPDVEGRTVAVLAANQDEPGVFYALTNKGLYRSPDAGLSWERLGLSLYDHYQRPTGLAVVEDS
ncbi:glycosyl hydrolase [soil metagenome]